MTSRPPTYRFQHLDHTADQAIAAYGDTLEETFEAAAVAMFSLWLDLDTIAPERTWKLEVRAPSLEDLLARWLKELLFLSEQEEAAFSRFRITALELNPWRLEATVSGAPFSSPRDEAAPPKIRRTGAPVKAVTHHDLTISSTPDGWRATVTFDV
jgi:SHS2 domain-containing protein